MESKRAEAVITVLFVLIIAASIIMKPIAKMNINNPTITPTPTHACQNIDGILLCKGDIPE